MKRNFGSIKNQEPMENDESLPMRERVMNLAREIASEAEGKEV
jgi:hypothetical protein